MTDVLSMASNDSFSPIAFGDVSSGSKVPRWNIKRPALYLLEQVFSLDKFPSLHMRQRLASDLNVTPRQIQVWFQNRRQRERSQARSGAIGDDKSNSASTAPTECGSDEEDRSPAWQPVEAVPTHEDAPASDAKAPPPTAVLAAEVTCRKRARAESPSYEGRPNPPFSSQKISSFDAPQTTKYLQEFENALKSLGSVPGSSGLKSLGSAGAADDQLAPAHVPIPSIPAARNRSQAHDESSASDASVSGEQVPTVASHVLPGIDQALASLASPGAGSSYLSGNQELLLQMLRAHGSCYGASVSTQPGWNMNPGAVFPAHVLTPSSMHALPAALFNVGSALHGINQFFGHGNHAGISVPSTCARLPATSLANERQVQAALWNSHSGLSSWGRIPPSAQTADAESRLHVALPAYEAPAQDGFSNLEDELRALFADDIVGKSASDGVHPNPICTPPSNASS